MPPQDNNCGKFDRVSNDEGTQLAKFFLLLWPGNNHGRFALWRTVAVFVWPVFDDSGRGF